MNPSLILLYFYLLLQFESILRGLKMSSSPRDVIHINFVAGRLLFDPRRIWTALRRAEGTGRISSAIHQQLQHELKDLALYLAGRDFMLRTATKELKRLLEQITKLIPDPGSLEIISDKGAHYRVINGGEVFKERDRVLLAVDSILFEFRAYLDILAKFTYRIIVAIGEGPSPKEQLSSGKLVTITDKKGRLKPNNLILYLSDRLALSVNWFNFLSNQRNFFTHEAAPYIALEILSFHPAQFDFIVMRVNIHNFSTANPADYFRFSEFNSVINGLMKFTQTLQGHLVKVLEKQAR